MRVAVPDLVDAPAGGAMALEIRLLVEVAALLEEHELGVLAVVRLLPASLHPPQFERREVVAGEVADEVRGADDDRAVDELHAVSERVRLTR